MRRVGFCTTYAKRDYLKRGKKYAAQAADGAFFQYPTTGTSRPGWSPSKQLDRRAASARRLRDPIERQGEAKVLPDLRNCQFAAEVLLDSELPAEHKRPTEGPSSFEEVPRPASK